MSRKNMIGAVLFAILVPQLLPAQQQQMTLHNVSGETFDVPLRKALPVDAPRVRYPGFKQETLILKAGTVRREGAMPLPCDILLERDVPIKLRDGVTIYTDVFRPVNEENCPAILPSGTLLLVNHLLILFQHFHLKFFRAFLTVLISHVFIIIPRIQWLHGSTRSKSQHTSTHK